MGNFVLAGSVSALAMALISGGSGALAQAAASVATTAAQAPDAGLRQSDAGLQDIVVTARKRAESLQKVPVAVTAVTAVQLAQNRVVSINDLGQLTPSLTFQQSSYSTFGTLIGIRGQKTGDTVLSQTPSIGIYIDDVYAPSTISTGVDNFYDVHSVEVLKGPQGTLYGRNTTGGAVKIENNAPDYAGFYGSAKLGFGNYGSDEQAAMVNVPLVDDKVAFRGVFEHNQHDGYARDLNNDRDVADSNTFSARGTLRLDPTDRFNITLRGNYEHGRSGGVIANLAAIQPVFGANGAPTFSPALLNVGLETGSISFADLLPFLTGGTPTAAQFANVIAGQQQAYADLQKYLKPGYRVAYSDRQFNRIGDAGGSVNSTYKLTDDLSIKSVTSYQHAFQHADADVDATPYIVLEGPADYTDLNQFTQELQLSGSAFDRKLQYTAGAYYYKMKGDDNSPGELELPFLNPDNPVNTLDHLTDRSISGYGQATYEILPEVHITGGLRYTSERTSLTSKSVVGPDDTCNVPPPGGVNGAPCSDTFSHSFSNISYTGGVDWQATSDIMVYFRTGRGFKAGGQNQRGTVQGGFDAFSPEVVTDYEIGAKMDLLDHRLRIDGAVYRSNYKDIQRSVLAVTSNNQTITEILNAAKARIWGAELETTFRPVHWLTIQLNGAYTDPKYLSYTSDGIDLSHDAFQDQPKWQGNLAVTYSDKLALGSLDTVLTATVNQTYQSKVSLGPDNTSIYDGNYSVQGSYGLLNMRVGLEFPRYGLTIEGWVKNLTNHHYYTGATNLTGALGVGNAYLSDPRTFGFDIIKRF
jgi:iron complex outermembrane receptor protein